MLWGSYQTFWFPGTIFFKDLLQTWCALDVRKTWITMSFWGKQQWDRMISNSSLTDSLHGGSVPNLQSPPRSECSGTLRTRVSVDFLRDWASDLGSLSAGPNLSLSSTKWPSLVSVCKWKQTLTEKLKKRPSSSTDEVQVRKHYHLRISGSCLLESLKKQQFF